MIHLVAAAANADVPINVAQNVGFGIIAAAMVLGAIRVVTTRIAEYTIIVAMIPKAMF